MCSASWCFPFEVSQVASTGIAARMIKEGRVDEGILIHAASTGLVVTDGSRPRFDDMFETLSTDGAAKG